MKILIIPSWYPNIKNSLLGSFFKEQAELLYSNGYDVKILSGKITYLDDRNYFIHKVKNMLRPTRQDFLDTEYLIQNPPALSFPINIQKSWSEEIINKSVCEIYGTALTMLIAGGWKPDVIHAHCTVDGGIIAHFLSTMFNVPYIIMEHQVFVLSMYSWYKQQQIKKALQNANKVAAVSYHQKRCILMHGIKCNPSVIGNYCNEDVFTIAPQNKKDKFRILTISYPAPIKDMDTFFKSIAAFCNVCKENIEVIVVGNILFDELQNANTSAFEELATKYGVHSKCTFIPYLSRNEIAALLNSVNVFISTSIAETFGIAVREAILCGVPVIATASGGVEDTINERTGIKVNIGDYTAIAESLIKIKNGDIKFDLAYNRNYVIAQYGKFAFLRQMQDFYTLND